MRGSSRGSCSGQAGAAGRRARFRAPAQHRARACRHALRARVGCRTASVCFLTHVHRILRVGLQADALAAASPARRPRRRSPRRRLGTALRRDRRAPPCASTCRHRALLPGPRPRGRGRAPARRSRAAERRRQPARSPSAACRRALRASRRRAEGTRRRRSDVGVRDEAPERFQRAHAGHGVRRQPAIGREDLEAASAQRPSSGAMPRYSRPSPRASRRRARARRRGRTSRNTPIRLRRSSVPAAFSFRLHRLVREVLADEQAAPRSARSSSEGENFTRRAARRPQRRRRARELGLLAADDAARHDAGDGPSHGG